MNQQQFIDDRLQVMPEGLSLIEASEYICTALRASQAYPKAPPQPRLWRHNPDGERACSYCSGFGQVQYEAGFTDNMAVMECPQCHGTGSPFIAVIHRKPESSPEVPAGYINRMGYE